MTRSNMQKYSYVMLLLSTIISPSLGFRLSPASDASRISRASFRLRQNSETAISRIFSPTPCRLLIKSKVLQEDEKTAPPRSFVCDPKALANLDKCSSSTQARRLLEKELLLQNNQNSDKSNSSCLYKSISIPAGASSRGISDGDLAIQTRLVNKKYNIMELIELSGNRDADRASLALLCLMIGSTMSAIVANQKLPGPEIFRFIVVWLLSFAPLGFVGYGIADAEKLQTILVSLQREVFPAYRKRMLQHEAGHFLMAHLLGWPIAGYSANAVKNAVEFYPLSDSDRGQDRARLLGFDPPKDRGNQDEPMIPILEDRQFFSSGGRGERFVEERSVFRNAKNYTDNAFLKLQPENDPLTAWPFRGFDEATLDQLAVISVAGVCSEILAFGNAEGGVADFNQLKQIFRSTDDSELTDRDVENKIRYALGYTISQLRRHLGVLDVLAEVMDRGGTVSECVIAIEQCTNISGQDEILGDYELRRRQEFRTQSASLVERLMLGDEKIADTEENRMVQGKGGGYKEEKSLLTGDDPLYAAIAVAIGFLLWASSGGLSLH